MIQCNHALWGNFIYSITKNDKVNNWSQNIHAITTYIESEHMKGKDNILAAGLSNYELLAYTKLIDLKKKSISMANLFLIQK